MMYVTDGVGRELMPEEGAPKLTKRSNVSYYYAASSTSACLQQFSDSDISFVEAFEMLPSSSVRTTASAVVKITVCLLFTLNWNYGMSDIHVELELMFNLTTLFNVAELV